jgi:hypothetical protein
MERWREKAGEMFPELAPVLERVDSPYDLWVDLWLAFEDAYEKTPPDESLIRRIYVYSDWCCEQPRGTTAADDLFTCVCVSFYEMIPLRPNPRHDMPRWWKSEDLENGPAGEPNVFAHRLSAKQFEELKRFLDREKNRYDPDLR